jgi:hypothetical protein
VRFAEGATLDSASPWLVAAARGKGDLAFVEWLASRGAATALKDKLGRTGAEQAHEENNTCAAQQGQSPAKIGQKACVFGKAHYVRHTFEASRSRFPILQTLQPNRTQSFA